jgi:hypothetical protein
MTARLAVAVGLAAALAGCKTANPLIGPPPQPVQQVYVVPADANFMLVVSEAVGTPEEDIPSYVKVFVDGQPAGQTPIDAKSKEKKWGDKLRPGNRLFRFEQWIQPFQGEWTPLAAQWQPPERFIRIEANQRAMITMKFLDGGRRFTSQLSRDPL